MATTETNRAYSVGQGAGRPTRVPQPSTQYKAIGEDTDGAYTFGEHELTMNFPLHVHHREDEGIYVLDGALKAVVGDETFTLGPGDFVFMPRGVPHSLTSEAASPARFVFVSTPGGFEHAMDDFIEVSTQGNGPGSPAWSEVETTHQLNFL